MNPDCHFGDHTFATNGWCRFCPTFNGGWLQWQAFEKAEREGRNHSDHYHRTLEARAACARLSSSVVTVNDDGAARPQGTPHGPDCICSVCYVRDNP